jgi:tetratricopeptide (TPR) repeat protein
VGSAQAQLSLILILAGAVPEEDPRVLFEQGLQAFDAGRYEDAAARFVRSLELREAGVVWFNLALAYHRLERFEAALHALRRYRELDPGADQKEIDRMIQELEAKLPAPNVIEPPPPQRRVEQPPQKPIEQQPQERVEQPPHQKPIEPPPPEPTAIYKTWWFWTLAGAALLATGIAVGVATQPDYDGGTSKTTIEALRW